MIDHAEAFAESMTDAGRKAVEAVNSFGAAVRLAMPSNDGSGYPWEHEAWYVAHKPRWDAMEAQGWKFRSAKPVFNRVGLTIFRGDDHYTMYISKDWSPEEIHTQLLERCEYHAAYPNN